MTKFIENNDKHLPYGENGKGTYSKITKGCFNVISNAEKLCLDSLEGKENLETFSMCDFGAADGGTSLPLIRNIIQKVVGQYKVKYFNLYYEDQSSNDYNSLFNRIQGKIEGAEDGDNESNGLMDYIGKVFVFASGSSFYEPCFPDNFLDFAFSSTSMHWLSSRPTHLKDTIHHAEKSLAFENKDELLLFKAQAKLDYNKLLYERSRELKSGASFVLVIFAINERGEYLGKEGDSSQKFSMFGVMNSIWKDFIKRGKITESEFNRMTFGNYYRSEQELLEPFNDPNCIFKCCSFEIKTIPCFYAEKWKSDKEYFYGNDPSKYAKDFVPTTRAWSQSTFMAGLDKEKRSKAKCVEIVDDFFDEYEKIVEKSPSSHGMPYTMGFMRLIKK
jgi:indole-3-acetate O-methyltransferase